MDTHRRVASSDAVIALPRGLTVALAFGSALSALGGGSVLVHSAHSVPLLLVRNEPENSYRRVLVAADSSPASRAATELARRLLDGRDGDVRLVQTPDRETATVQTELAVWQPDLLVVGIPSGSRPHVNTMGGAAARALVRRADCDVLVAPEPRPRASLLSLRRV